MLAEVERLRDVLARLVAEAPECNRYVSAHGVGDWATDEYQQALADAKALLVGAALPNANG